MKTLYLMRHGKTAPVPAGGQDRDRFLTDEGKQVLHALGKEIAARGYKPDCVLCSPVRRTKETLVTVQEGYGETFPAVSYPEKLYDAYAGDLLEQIHVLGDGYQSVLVIAHNPGIYMLASMLAGKGEAAHFDKLSLGYAPGTLSVIECDCANWQAVGPGDNLLRDILI